MSQAGRRSGGTATTAADHYWDAKSSDEIIADVNTALTGVYSGSLQTEIADTILLPVAQYTMLANLRVEETSISIMDFLKAYNLYTAETGNPLTIRALRGLENAGSAATSGTGGATATLGANNARMIAYRREPGVLKLHLPMPHRFLPPERVGPLSYVVPGIFRLGGLEIRRPGAIRYVDGIGA